MRMNNAPPGVTRLLREMSDGNREALDELVPLICAELRCRTRARLQYDRLAHTLQATPLVHEAYLRRIDQKKVRRDWRTVKDWLAHELYEVE